MAPRFFSGNVGILGRHQRARNCAKTQLGAGFRDKCSVRVDQALPSTAVLDIGHAEMTQIFCEATMDGVWLRSDLGGAPMCDEGVLGRSLRETRGEKPEQLPLQGRWIKIDHGHAAFRKLQLRAG